MLNPATELGSFEHVTRFFLTKSVSSEGEGGLIIFKKVWLWDNWEGKKTVMVRDPA